MREGAEREETETRCRSAVGENEERVRVNGREPMEASWKKTKVVTVLVAEIETEETNIHVDTRGPTDDVCV